MGVRESIAPALVPPEMQAPLTSWPSHHQGTKRRTRQMAAEKSCNHLHLQLLHRHLASGTTVQTKMTTRGEEKVEPVQLRQLSLGS